MFSNIKRAIILVNTLVEAKLCKLPHYNIFSNAFALTNEQVYDVITYLEECIKRGDYTACYSLAKIYCIS